MKFNNCVEFEYGYFFTYLITEIAQNAPLRRSISIFSRIHHVIQISQHFYHSCLLCTSHYSSLLCSAPENIFLKHFACTFLVFYVIFFLSWYFKILYDFFILSFFFFSAIDMLYSRNESIVICICKSNFGRTKISERVKWIKNGPIMNRGTNTVMCGEICG